MCAFHLFEDELDGIIETWGMDADRMMLLVLAARDISELSDLAARRRYMAWYRRTTLLPLDFAEDDE